MKRRQLSLSTVANMPEFDGATYDPEKDKNRLANQLWAIRDFMLRDPTWRVPDDIAKLSNVVAGSAGITARVRDLRKAKFGNYLTPGRRKKNGGGIWEYRLYLRSDPEAGPYLEEEENRRNKRGSSNMRACPDCNKRHHCSRANQLSLPVSDEMKDKPWPLRDVVTKLLNAVDHLMKDHDCDHHGYEDLVAARDAGKLWLAASSVL